MVKLPALKPAQLYMALTVCGFVLLVSGAALVFPPAAFFLAGLILGGLGLIGIGIQRP